MPRSKPPRHPRRKGPTPPRTSAPDPNLPPEIAQLVGQLRAASSPFERARPVPSRRRPPREEAVTYRIRVELDDVEPPIWRVLELASDLPLDRMHDLLQTAMGWTDSHLHEFASGDSPTDRLAEHYRPQQSIDNDLQGIDESTVRLDEVLVEPGDRLFYGYDFGDDWAHTLLLEAVVPRDPGMPSAHCLAGARACPPEDCGGVWGYHNLLAALRDPSAPDRDELMEWIGPNFDPEFFDVKHVNDVLARVDRIERARAGVLTVVDPATPLGELLSRMVLLPELLTDAVTAARLPTVEPDLATKTAMLRAHSQLLELVGDKGVTLTQAGYLPPALVEAVSDVLNLDDIWIDKNNREVQTYPVLEFRESTQRLGLLRKAHNKLTLTKTGLRARADVEALWRTVADGLPLVLTTRGPEVRASHDAGLLLLLGVAAGYPRAERTALVSECLDILGWRPSPFSSLSERDVQELLGPTETVLEHVGAIPRTAWRDRNADRSPDPAGAAFARAALGM